MQIIVIPIDIVTAKMNGLAIGTSTFTGDISLDQFRRITITVTGHPSGKIRTQTISYSVGNISDVSIVYTPNPLNATLISLNVMVWFGLDGPRLTRAIFDLSDDTDILFTASYLLLP
jgi:hypothetical protein